MSINIYRYGEKYITLHHAVYDSNPWYVFIARDQNTALYSQDFDEILSYITLKGCNRPSVDPEMLERIMNASVLAPPRTVIDGLYMSCPCSRLYINSNCGDIKIELIRDMFWDQSHIVDNENGDQIIEILSKSLINKIEQDKPIYLFHSSGKDSNAVALALAYAGLQQQCTFVHVKASSTDQESQISQSIAEELGFRHQIVTIPTVLTEQHKTYIDGYFESPVLPSLDSLTLPLSLVPMFIPSIRDSNIIDGGGNDAYLGVLPDQRRWRVLQEASKNSSLAYLIDRYAHSESASYRLFRYPSERDGFLGISYRDMKSFYNHQHKVFATEWERLLVGLPPKTRKSFLVGSITAHNLHIAKMRNLAYSQGSNLVLPWCDRGVYEYCMSLSYSRRIDFQERKNKVFLRDQLEMRLRNITGIRRKFDWSYDPIPIVASNIDYFQDVIESSGLLCTRPNSTLKRLTTAVLRPRSHFNQKSAARLLQHLFLISKWYKCSSLLE